MRATQQDGSYPRPTLCRDRWTSLDGPWEFAHDDADEGLTARWFDAEAEPFDLRIEVPFPPESPASGIAAREFHPVVWYRRRIAHDTLAAQDDGRVLVHFGAVDYRAAVWVNGHLVVEHEGGHTPFSADITAALRPDGEQVVVVRAEDLAHDLTQPRIAEGGGIGLLDGIDLVIEILLCLHCCVQGGVPRLRFGRGYKLIRLKLGIGFL